jgi:hypothetical protein
VYIREAHPTEESTDRRVAPGGGGHGAASLAKSEAERHATARKCVDGLGLTLPTVVDSLDNDTSRTWGAWPDRLFIVGKGGTVVFAGAPGPKGFVPDEVEAALEQVLAGPPTP